MDEARKARGAEIAKQNRIRKAPKGYLVPSQSGQGKYAVIVDGDKPSCTCPDHELHGGPCKHIYAVQIVIQQEFDFARGTVTETVTVTKTVKRTYPQDWPAYNKAVLLDDGDQRHPNRAMGQIPSVWRGGCSQPVGLELPLVQSRA